ncbi:MAG: hypothetical protein Q6361_03385, partial [Candidatus Hermodarchaeota archaeon]|nr:hypothetical protein [Candidatus Hermodarchaeota archaeon]
MKTSRLFSIVLLVTLLTPLVFTPLLGQVQVNSTLASSDAVTNSNFFKADMANTIPPHMVRVAIYNEPNLTAPVYATSPGDLNNNVTQFAALLNAHGFQTTLLDVHDIYNNELITANYDVFALVDNYPRENITNKVQDFWLAGGSLLLFDSPIDYLCYYGILPPESGGSSGFPGYWQFGSGNFTITQRHPVTRSYAVSDQIQADDFYGYGYWDWTALAASVIGSDLTRIATPDV